MHYLQTDKLLHIAIGAGITLVLSLIVSVWVAFAVACLVGFFKEVYDYLHPDTHTCDGLDFLATTVGGLGTLLLLMGFK